MKVLVKGRNIEAVRVGYSPISLDDSDNPAAVLSEKLGCVISHISKALNDNAAVR
ncbi:hypothetical protein D3C87_2088430 [compost metagenome]